MFHHDQTPLPRDSLTVASVLAYVFRAPIAEPVRTSFGIMRDRPAVLLRVTDTDGVEGWGETWCNFPACGAEHRARLIDTVLAPLLLGRQFAGPEAAFSYLSAQTEVLKLQCGEPGPLSQAIAGLDIALWDLSARRAGMPLWRYLGGTRNEIGVYASGINPDNPESVIQQKLSAGHVAFKLKVGFDDARDMENVRRLSDMLSPQYALMLDANQGWNIDRALAMTRALKEYNIGWIEEPLRANVCWESWRQLANSTSIPLAAGENLLELPSFEQAIASGALQVVQPDMAKWGGISGNWPVIERIAGRSLRYCPHYLGAGIGLLASAHLLAASGADGMLEIDANPNPLRTLPCPDFERPDQGRVRLGTEPGLGTLPAIEAWTEIAKRCH